MSSPTKRNAQSTASLSMLRTGDYNGKRNFVSVPSYRHYFRNTPRSLRTKRADIDEQWQPSCRFFLATLCTVFILSFLIFLKSKLPTYYTYHWKWHLSDNSNTHMYKFNSMQQVLDKWLAKYPQNIEPHVAYPSFTCDAWQCQPTFNVAQNEWIEPRKEYKMLLPNSNAYNNWMALHQQQSQSLLDKTQQCEWIFIGDSITHSWNYNMDVFNKYFNKQKQAVIYAESGDKIHEVGWRLTNGEHNGFHNMRQCLLNGSMKQKSIVLLIGTNDIGSGSRFDVALKDYMVLLDQLTEFVDDINKHQKVVLYLMAIFPRGEHWLSRQERQKQQDRLPTEEQWNAANPYFYSINFVNDYLQTFARNHVNDNVRYIDCKDHFLSATNQVEFKDNDGDLHEYSTGTMTIDIMDDMLHLTAKGYEQWAQCILTRV